MENKIILKPKAIMSRNSVSLMGCINYFEDGDECVYLIDEAGKYSWQAIPRQDLSLRAQADGGWGIKVKTIAPIIFTLPIENENIQLLIKACETMLAQYPEVKELPIVQEDGRIVAVAKINQSISQAIDWSILKGVFHGIPHGKIYLTSEYGTQLGGLYELLKNICDVEILREDTIQGILSGRVDGTLIYGEDIYPDNIRKLAATELYQKMIRGQRYEHNLASLECYEHFHGDLSATLNTEGQLPDVESRCQEFLSQVDADKPIIIKDAYDIEELTWMCAKLRCDEKFGSDNRLYIEYSSLSDFAKSMENFDWTNLVEQGKIVFMFGEVQKEKYYPKVIIKSKPKPLEIEEIKEIVSTVPNGYSGSDFFNMILDGHPLLLTIGWHGLPTYSVVWKQFCENKTVSEAIEHMKHPVTIEEANLLEQNLSNMLKYKYKERLEPFFSGIVKCLDSDKKYGMVEWFKAFYLSANDAVGREFKQRITPAIFYDEHGVNQGQVCLDFKLKLEDLQHMKAEIIGGFEYKRFVGIVRAPLSKMGCMMNSFEKYGPQVWCDSITKLLKKFAGEIIFGNYKNQDDNDYYITRHFRFEDLKLYPKETTEELCKYLRLPWAETCMHITTNGEDSGKVDGTAGFDIKPVFNTHPEHMTTLDYYRMELINYKKFSIWGYKPRYYDGVKYTPDALKKLFDIPFKVELQHMDKWPDWPNEKAIAEFHEWIYKRALDVMENGEKMPMDSHGNPKRLVECIFPDLPEGQRLFEA